MDFISIDDQTEVQQIDENFFRVRKQKTHSSSWVEGEVSVPNIEITHPLLYKAARHQAADIRPMWVAAQLFEINLFPMLDQ